MQCGRGKGWVGSLDVWQSVCLLRWKVTRGSELLEKHFRIPYLPSTPLPVLSQSISSECSELCALTGWGAGGGRVLLHIMLTDTTPHPRSVPSPNPAPLPTDWTWLDAEGWSELSSPPSPHVLVRTCALWRWWRRNFPSHLMLSAAARCLYRLLWDLSIPCLNRMMSLRLILTGEHSSKTLGFSQVRIRRIGADK